MDQPTRLSESVPDPFVGRTFDGYRVEEILGRGGMGVVYRATQLSLNRPVALKVLPEAFAEDAQFLDRFEREVDVLSRLSHPNVVTVFERGEVDGRPYVAMEYVAGTTLREVLRKGPLPAAEALVLVRGILAALEHAHGLGIVHRDIKPENVLLAPGGICKVADFGLSRVLQGDETTRLTHTQLTLGTFEYMAPEQRERAKEADERADLYATGVVLYEMIAGELPIGHFARLSEKRPQECDARLDEIIRRSLEKAPERRYQEAQAMGGDVSRLLSAPAAVPAPPPADAARRRFLPWLAGAVAAAAVFVIAVVAIERPRDEHLFLLAIGAALTCWGVSRWMRGLPVFGGPEYPLVRPDGRLPRRFAQEIVEDPAVQRWLADLVPLWPDFPEHLDFSTDDGRLMLEIEGDKATDPEHGKRIATAIAAVLAANGGGRRIAVADPSWEAEHSTALADPPLVSESDAPAAPPANKGGGGLAFLFRPPFLALLGTALWIGLLWNVATPRNAFEIGAYVVAAIASVALMVRRLPATEHGRQAFGAGVTALLAGIVLAGTQGEPSPPVVLGLVGACLFSLWFVPRAGRLPRAPVVAALAVAATIGLTFTALDAYVVRPPATQEYSFTVARLRGDPDPRFLEALRDDPYVQDWVKRLTRAPETFPEGVRLEHRNGHLRVTFEDTRWLTKSHANHIATALAAAAARSGRYRSVAPAVEEILVKDPPPELLRGYATLRTHHGPYWIVTGDAPPVFDAPDLRDWVAAAAGVPPGTLRYLVAERDGRRHGVWVPRTVDREAARNVAAALSYARHHRSEGGETRLLVGDDAFEAKMQETPFPDVREGSK